MTNTQLPSAAERTASKTTQTTYIPPAEAQRQAPAPSADANVRVERHQTTQISRAESISQGREGWAATLRTKHGGPVQGEPTMDDMVTLQAHGRDWNMSIRQAITAGLLTQDAEGNVTEVTAADREAADKQTEEAEEEARRQDHADFPHLQEVDPAANRAMIDLQDLASKAGADLVGAVHHYLAAGEISPEMKAAAKHFGKGDIQQHIDTAYRGFEAQAEAVLKANGVFDVDQFYGWLHAMGRARDGKRAILHMIHDRPDGLRHLAQQYRETSPVDHSRHGLEVIKRRGAEYVRWPNGVEMEARKARREGIL